MCLLSLVTWHGSTRRRATEQARNRSSIIYNVLILFSHSTICYSSLPLVQLDHIIPRPQPMHLSSKHQTLVFVSSRVFYSPTPQAPLFFSSFRCSLSLSLSLMYSVDPSIMFLFEAWNPPAAYADVVMSMYPYSSSFSLYFKIYIFFKPTDYS
jgi:hypothetical protein